MLAGEKEAASAFIFASRGKRDDLVRVMSSPLNAAVKAVTGESLRSRPSSLSMNRSVFLRLYGQSGEKLNLLNSFVRAVIKHSMLHCASEFSCELRFHVEM